MGETVWRAWKTCRCSVRLSLAVVVQADGAAPPEAVPGHRLRVQQLREAGGAFELAAGGVARLRDPALAGREEGDGLLDGEGHILFEVVRDVQGDVAGLLLELRVQLARGSLAVQPHTRRLGDAHVTLAGLDHQADAVVGLTPRAQRDQVSAVELAVARHAGVGDPAVEGREDRDTARPVARHDRGLERGHVLVAHVDEASLGDLGLPAGVVPERDEAREDAAAHVEVEAVALHLDLREVEPLAVLDAERQRQPVGHVDEVLVLDRPAAAPRWSGGCSSRRGRCPGSGPRRRRPRAPRRE